MIFLKIGIVLNLCFKKFIFLKKSSIFPGARQAGFKVYVGEKKKRDPLSMKRTVRRFPYTAFKHHQICNLDVEAAEPQAERPGEPDG